MTATLTRLQRSAARNGTEMIPPPPPPLTVEETAAARAAIYTTALWQASGEAYPLVPVTAWVGMRFGTAIADLPDGTRIVHTPDSPDGPPSSLTAFVTCPQGERHEHVIVWPRDLEAARSEAAACTTDHDAPEHLDEGETAKPHFRYASPADFTGPARTPGPARMVAAVLPLHSVDRS